jgi:serine/threonine protein kinase
MCGIHATDVFPYFVFSKTSPPTGEVFRGQWRQTDVAIKRFLDQDIGHRLVQGFVKEVAIMKRLHHPNVVQFMGACTQPPNLCIVTQYVPRGSLFKLLHRTSYVPDNRRRLRMALDVARGMNYLHTCRPPVIHRDLKSPNLLVDTDMTVKVCDFGLSQVKSSNVLSAKTQAGTPEWTAPEVLQGGACSEASDVYAFGVIVWELLTGEEPWVDKTAMQVVGAVGFSGELLDIPADASPAMKDLLQRCFGSPENRPQFSEIIPLLKRQLVQLQATTRKQGSAESVTTSETLDEVRD